VFKYKRKTNRAQGWTEEAMYRAINAINEKEYSIRGAAVRFGIPYPTLRKHVITQSSKKELGRFRPVFSDDMEQQLMKHIQEMDARFYGLTKQDLCTLAYEFANQNNLVHNFQNERAGEQWYSNFMQRHPELSLRAPEPTSIARACGFNKPQVQLFFDNLKTIRENHNIELDNIYNVDETGIQTSAKKPPKVISTKGKKQVGSISSAERGQLVTALCCCSASGKFIPPALIFPRKKRNARYLNGTPPGTIDFVSDNGWVNSEIFLEWLKFFVKSVRPTSEQKCLLILDNHVSHRSLDVLEYASQNNLVILSVPPHCTHKLQPLDVAVYGPLGKYFERTVDKWQKQHPAQHITLYELGELFGSAYLQSATPQNAISGFKKTGILDGDIDVFSDIDFAPSKVTDREYEIQDNEHDLTIADNNHSSPNLSIPSCSTQEIMEKTQRFENIECYVEHRTPPTSPIPSCSMSPTQKTTPHVDRSRSASPIPGCSYHINDENVNIANKDVAKYHFTPIYAIKPLPKAVQNETKRKRKTQKSEILTSTPVKEALRNQKIKTNQKVPKTKLHDERTNSTNNKKSKLTKSKIPTEMMFQYPQEPVKKVDPNEENVPCLVCGDTYVNSKSGEPWIQCNMCQNWAHQLCADYNTGIYICDNCKSSVLSTLK
jgi:hypothetical protein